MATAILYAAKFRYRAAGGGIHANLSGSELPGGLSGYRIPGGYAPCTVRNCGQVLREATQRTPPCHDDVAGTGTRLRDRLSPTMRLVQRIVTRGQRNSHLGDWSWTPDGFGSCGGTLWSGTVM